MKKISVITVNYNNRNGLEKTIRSVALQTYPNIEYIVIDGGSEDGSAEAIYDNAKNITYYCSEKDNGTYDAMNKGIHKATGDYVLFLNSGDMFCNKDVLQNIFGHNVLQSQLVVGRQYQLRNGRRKSSRRIAANGINEDFLVSNTLPHQATFISRILLNEIGGYRLDYRIVADWVFWYEAIVDYGATIESVNTFVAVMDEEGLSADIDKCRDEMARFLSKRHTSLSTDMWKHIIQQNNDSYMYNRARRGKIGRFLVRLALRLYK